MSRSITITIPGVPDQALRKNRGDRSHWRYRQKAAKEMREECYDLITLTDQYQALLASHKTGEYWEAPFEKATITITQFYSGKPLDHSGLCSGTAPAVDSFVDAGVIEDDAPKFIVDFIMRYVHVARADARVEITVEEAKA